MIPPLRNPVTDVRFDEDVSALISAHGYADAHAKATAVAATTDGGERDYWRFVAEVIKDDWTEREKANATL